MKYSQRKSPLYKNKEFFNRHKIINNIYNYQLEKKEVNKSLTKVSRILRNKLKI